MKKKITGIRRMDKQDEQSCICLDYEDELAEIINGLLGPIQRQPLDKLPGGNESPVGLLCGGLIYR